jgi:2-polyprenyl-3-methyl-5-hydroxy-6-metoxy-1,4-benzoquinol methylase
MMSQVRNEVMAEVDEALGEGHYARKQLFCKNRLISWSHRSRFEIGLHLARRFRAGRALDYGCGDGTFAVMLASDARSRPGEIVGVEIHDDLVMDCRTRLGRYGLSFTLADELERPEHIGAYDLIFCMEVLEHVISLEQVLDRIERALAPQGTLLVSVPVETGLPLLLKQSVRRIAGWRGVGDYKYTSSYTLGEYWSSLFAGPRQHIVRPIYGEANSLYHDHKGFNWMLLRNTLSERFELCEVLSSPVTWLSPHLASQVWFVLKKRA